MLLLAHYRHLSRGAYEGPLTIFTDPSFEGCFYTFWRCLL